VTKNDLFPFSHLFLLSSRVSRAKEQRKEGGVGVGFGWEKMGTGGCGRASYLSTLKEARSRDFGAPDGVTSIMTVMFFFESSLIQSWT